MRKKLWKWTQVALGLIMLLLSWFFIETNTSVEIPKQNISVTGELSALDLANQKQITQPTVVDTDFWLGFLGFWLALA